MDLNVSNEAEGDTAVLRVRGSVDVASRDQLAAAAGQAIDAGATSVVIDLSEVTFMDSTGIGALVEIAGRMEDADGSFAIAHPSRPVARLLEVSGLSAQWAAPAD